VVEVQSVPATVDILQPQNQESDLQAVAQDLPTVQNVDQTGPNNEGGSLSSIDITRDFTEVVGLLSMTSAVDILQVQTQGSAAQAGVSAAAHLPEVQNADQVARISEGAGLPELMPVAPVFQAEDHPVVPASELPYNITATNNLAQEPGQVTGSTRRAMGDGNVTSQESTPRRSSRQPKKLRSI
jgi:hypothetical protein